MPTRTPGLPYTRRARFRPMRLYVALDDTLVNETDRRTEPAAEAPERRAINDLAVERLSARHPEP